MNFSKTEIDGIIIIESDKLMDHRGFFMESFHKEKFSTGGIGVDFVQDNHAKSSKNTLRGLHYQHKYPQGKLIRCIKGEIFDVAVDIRKDSNTFGHWYGLSLSEVNNLQLYVPTGMAHGYLVLSDEAEVVYKCTDIYHPEDEFGITWNDEELNINWGGIDPILSKKDKSWPKLKDAVVYESI